MRVGFPDPEAIYRFGWMMARVREDGFALDLLRRAVTGGFTCPFHMSADPWFDAFARRPGSSTRSCHWRGTGR